MLAGNRIRLARIAGHLNQIDVGERSGLGTFRVWLIESGRKQPTRAEEVALRRALRTLWEERSAEFYALLEETN